MRRRLVAFKHVDQGWQWVESHEISAPDSALLDNLNIWKLKGVVNHEGFILRQIATTFKDRSKSQRVRLCAEWLFDSYASDNDLLSFVQTIIDMEILFGDKRESDIIGLGKLLANRCAYLIGNTYSERFSMLSDFEIIHELRSKIVHGGRSYIDNKDWMLFDKLRWLCRRSI